MKQVMPETQRSVLLHRLARCLFAVGAVRYRPAQYPAVSVRYRLTRHIAAVSAALFLLAGCAANGGSAGGDSAQQPAAEDAILAEQGEPGQPGMAADADAYADAQTESRDALEQVNRPVFGFNYSLDRAVVKPVAQAYDRAMPGWFKRRVSNFFHWLREPGNTVNNLLQGKGKSGMISIWRFLINGSFGLAGLYDPAARMGLERAGTDFDATLAKWGMDAGNYIVLPIIGSTDMRDILGLVGDAALSPTLFFQPSELAVGTTLLNAVDTRAALLPLEGAVVGEPYTFVREAYLQSREDETQREGEAGEPAQEDEFDF